ncbi:MAG: RNA polymerase sigma factor [Bacteroidales bacterium]|nr:RNA polymerase sigma factor [Bacteroidales bacterium]
MDKKEFTKNIVPLKEKLLRTAFYITQEKDDAEDIVQETFLKLWCIRDSLDRYDSIEALSVQIAKNLSLDLLRKRKPTENEEVLFLVESKTPSPYEMAERNEAIEKVREMIDKLPSLQQMIIRMKDIEGYEIEEIADITCSTNEAVRTNLSRARKKIRDQLLGLNKSFISNKNVKEKII